MTTPTLSFEEILQHFKASEQPECLLLISDDPASLKIAAAWTGMAVPRVEIPQPPPSVEERWGWLWSRVSYSVADVALRTGLTVGLVERKLPALIANRTIYPDGTANSYVQRYLRERVLKLFRPATKREPTG